jgi:serine/threonine protein kinase
VRRPAGEDLERGTRDLVRPGDLLLGRYRAIELIAEGGQSLIWRVTDERLKRPACAKAFHGAAFSTSVRRIVEQAFVEEAYLLARFAHPAALEIYDFGILESAGVPVQICELVNGGPLSDWVAREGPLAPADVLGLLPPMVRVLAELHDSGIVHLDVKPQNILIRRGSGHCHPKLADFGIARPIGSSSAGDGGVLMYSVNWAAPEQLIGERLSPATDVYALALVVIFALTGKRVFGEPDPDQGYRLRRYTDDLIAETLAEAGLPDAAVAVLQAACRFEPDARIGDITEFGRQLEDALAPVASRPAISLGGPPINLGGSIGGSPINLGGSPAGPPGARGESTRAVATPLWSLALDRPCPEVAGRQLQFLPLEPTADLNAAGGAARVRLSLVDSSGDRCALHMQGLNCFVAAAGGRPSPALTLAHGAAVELFSPRGDRVSRADVAFAAAGPSKSVVTLGQERLVIAAANTPIVMLDFGRDGGCFLVHGKVRLGA